MSCKIKTVLFFFFSFTIAHKKNHIYIFGLLLSPSHWWSGAGWTSHWVWGQPALFHSGSWTVTPPTGCAHRPGYWNQTNPTRSTPPHGNRWQKSDLRKKKKKPKMLKLKNKKGFGSFRVLQRELTVDVNQSSDLVVVISTTGNISQSHRGVSWDQQPVDHCKEGGVNARIQPFCNASLADISFIFLLPMSLSTAAAMQFFGSSIRAVIPATCKINSHHCTSKQNIKGNLCWCNNAPTAFLSSLSFLTCVAVLLSVTQQLEVLVPDTQLLPAGDPHGQSLQHKQTLR